MGITRRRQRGRHAAVGRGRYLVGAIVAAVVLTVAAVVTVAIVRSITADAPTAAPTITRSATPTPPQPLTPAEALPATSTDPNACAVSFAGDGITDAPQLQIQGTLYDHLPIPQQDGAVFAGWYTTPEDAQTFTVAARVNGADAVACAGRELTLHGSWRSPEEVAAEDVGVPILMYHQFTTKPEGESGWLKANYAYIGDFDAHMTYLQDGGFYLPTWDELSAFIDGRLYVPARSVIITDDDADSTWLELAAPIVHGKSLLTTSFVITSARTEPTPNMYVLQRSHTHDMHTAGENGRGRMENWTAEQIAADMETSAQILGVKEVMAYPFGHYDETAKEGLRQAGFELARTIEPGYVHAGADKLALPTIRINYGMGLDAFQGLVG
ncbi:polysaccharide deacetylase family protein [Microbacterium sp. 18062]|uniref:polysaccharide deacetylase family protein n=1 Tax=Microbacterium sp. 18062 TaxID=2681410 RepID=UPI00135A0115|nr:polysaccharide deacetylase family protein [Microbacterium sp. 18062]